MNLSNEQYKILKIFYENEKISLSKLSKYGIREHDTPFFRLTNLGYLKHTDIELSETDKFFERQPEYGYRITSTGKAAYENYLEVLAKKLNDEQTLDYQKRQTIATERSANADEKANEIATEALDEARKARREARIAYVIAGISLFVAIIVGAATIGKIIYDIIKGC